MTAGWLSARQNWQKPPDRPVLEPAERLDVVADERGLVRLGGVPPRLEGRIARPAGRTGRRSPSGGRGARARWAQSRSGHRSGPAEVGGGGHGLGAELGDEPGQDGQAGQRGREVPLVAVIPAEVEVGVGAPGRVGKDAGVGDHRSGAVGLLERALDRAVERRLVPGRQGLAGDESGRHPGARNRCAACRVRRRWPAARCARTTRRSRDGGRAGRPPRGPGGRPGGGPRRSPTAAGGPARAAGRAGRRPSYSSGRLMWAWTRSRSRPAWRASTTSRSISAGGRLGQAPGGSARGWRPSG